MTKIIAAINMSVDGNCDHTAGLPDEDIHKHYTDLLNQGDAIVYGRKTFELMKFWRTFLNNPSGTVSMDEFALAINRIPKIVFSNTLSHVDWETATLAKDTLEEKVLKLKEGTDKTIFIGSRSLINQLTKLNLIDEYQLCINPIVAGLGLQLFNDIQEKVLLKLKNTKTFKNGAIILYYEPLNIGV